MWLLIRTALLNFVGSPSASYYSAERLYREGINAVGVAAGCCIAVSVIRVDRPQEVINKPRSVRRQLAGGDKKAYL